MHPDNQPENIAEALAIANEWNFRRQARIEALEEDRDRMKARLDWIVLKCHWTSEQMQLGAYAAIDEEMRKEGKP